MGVTGETTLRREIVREHVNIRTHLLIDRAEALGAR
jgi:hypothetical protein